MHTDAPRAQRGAATHAPWRTSLVLLTPHSADGSAPAACHPGNVILLLTLACNALLRIHHILETPDWRGLLWRCGGASRRFGPIKQVHGGESQDTGRHRPSVVSLSHLGSSSASSPGHPRHHHHHHHHNPILAVTISFCPLGPTPGPSEPLTPPFEAGEFGDEKSPSLGRRALGALRRWGSLTVNNTHTPYPLGSPHPSSSQSPNRPLPHPTPNPPASTRCWPGAPSWCRCASSSR
jgi:hypothetical protein